MERLTYDFCVGGNHCWQVKGADNLECREVCERQEDGCMDCPIAKAFDRLAAIEDILDDEYDLDRLRELAQADRGGRCAVLPCKVGDTIYFIGEEFYNYQLHSGLQKGRVKGFEFDKTWLVWVHFEKDTPTAGVAFKVKDFGKTVFLTREEAEEALKKGWGDHD